jgi:hypothetical protein
MHYLTNNEVVSKALNEIGLIPASKDDSFAGFYKALFNPKGWDYLYRGRGYIKDFKEVRNKYMPKWLQDKTRHLPDKNVNIYDIGSLIIKNPKGLKPIFNHYPNAPCITNKANLLKTLQQVNKEDLLPLTFNLSDEADQKAFDSLLQTEEGKSKFWIYKPEYMYGGKGIQLISPGPETAGVTVLKNGVIQEYLMNPMTIGSINPRKIDYRVMAMMVDKPGAMRFYMSPLVFVRASGYPFVKTFDIPNPEYAHITNESFQKHTTNFGKYEEGNTLSFDLSQNQNLELKLKAIIKDVFKACTSGASPLIMQGTFGTKGAKNVFRPFEIFGFDFLVLDDGNVKLLEVNDNAGMEWNNKEADKLGEDMIEEAVLLSLAILEGGNPKDSRLWVKL